MRAVALTALVWCGTAVAQQAVMPEEITAEWLATAMRRNEFAAEAMLGQGREFRFTGVPESITRGPGGIPMLRYKAEFPTVYVEARMTPGMETAAARIAPGQPVTLVCNGGGPPKGMAYPFVSGCRPDKSSQAPAPR